MLSLLSLVVALTAHAANPDPALFGSPAMLVDYRDFSSRASNFNTVGSETRAFSDLVEILYDWDNNRPWGSDFFPVANERLKEFRARVCPMVPGLGACFAPRVIWSGTEIALLQKSLLASPALSSLGQRWGLEIAPWVRPLREPAFSLLIGETDASAPVEAAYWNLPAAKVEWRTFRHTYLNDKDNYRAGFDQKDVGALFSHFGRNMRLNDWLLRDRTMGFAASWKHAIGASEHWNPTNPIVEAPARLFLKLREEQAARFEHYFEILKDKVTGEHLQRFEKERAAGEYPEEIYQHVAYEQLREILQIQGSYFARTLELRKNTSVRQKSLESLLTIQRYHSSPRIFAMEMITMMEPLSSRAFVLDAATDLGIVQALVMEELKAVLGSEPYVGKALFPAVGKSLLEPELFRATYLDEYAPDIKEQLAGRDFTTLDIEEQLRIFKLYLQPKPGKFRPMALYRMGVLLLATASDADLRQLADVVHEARKGGFR